MNYFYNITQIPLVAWVIIFGISLGLLAVVSISRHRKGFFAESNPNEPAQHRWKRLLVKTLRLTLFGVFSLVLMSVVLMFVLNYQAMIKETAPAPSQVEIPADLPFAVEEVTFLSRDGLQIVGWFVPPHNGVTVILLHGYGGNRLGVRWYAEQLTSAGYGVLMYDERASGESEGDYRSYGWEDERDVAGAISFLKSRPEVDPAKIGIGGCSMGAQIALQGAAFHSEIGAVWADGPSVILGVDNVPPQNLLRWLVNVGNFQLDWQYKQHLDIEPPRPMIEIIGDIAPRPIMLVAGGIERPFLGNEALRVDRYAQFAGENAQVWVIDEAFHCDGPRQRPEEYATRLVGFFDEAFEVEREK